MIKKIDLYIYIYIYFLDKTRLGRYIIHKTISCINFIKIAFIAELKEPPGVGVHI